MCEGLACTRGDYEVDGVGHDLSDAEWQYADDLHMIDDHCTYEGTRSSVCKVCNEPITELYRLKNNHIYITEIDRQATCTADGTIVTKCTVCGDVIASRSYSDDLAHDWNDGERQGSVTVYTCNHNSNHIKRVIVADEGAAEATFTKDALSDVDEISISNAAISFDSIAMESLPADEEVKLSVEIADNNEIDTAIREKITNELYDINLTADSGGITSFGGGKAKISLPYNLKEGEDLDTLVVWYLNGSTLEPIESTYSNGYVIFETTHFSLYTVGNYTPEEACAALGHNQVNRRTEATCTEDGVEEDFCTRCGEVFSKEVFPALGHKWQPDEETSCEATCTEKGAEGFVCSVCGEKRSEEIPALGHEYEKEVVQPTCAEEGYTIYTCIRCDDTYNGDYTSALGHEYKKEVVPSTCMEEGYTIFTCIRYDDTYNDVFTPALEHEWQSDEETSHEATCTEKGAEGFVCSVCGEKRSEEIPALGHDYKEEVVQPTCAEEGYTIYTCTRCDDTYTDDYVPALVHNYYKKIIQSCTEEGYTIYTCARCGYTYNDDFTPALGHEWNILEPTCVWDKVCVRCNALGAPATGNHNYEDGKCTVCGQLDDAHHWLIVNQLSPTCTQYGYEHYACTDDDCNEENFYIIDPHGHVYEQPEMNGSSVRCIYCNEPAPEDNVIVFEPLYGRYAVGIWERKAVGEATFAFSLVFYSNGEEALVPLNLTSTDYSIEYPLSLEMLGSRAPAYVLTVTNENLIGREINSASQTLGNSCYVGMQVTVTAENVTASVLLNVIGIENKHELYYSDELSIPYDEAGCGELYGNVFVCRICGYIDEEFNVREHTYREIPELAPDSITCFDGVIYKDTCTACGEVRGERRDTPESHACVEVTYKFETPCGTKTLTQYVCVCGLYKGEIFGLYNRNNGCYYIKQYEDYNDDGRKLESFLCLECGSTMVIESYNLEEGCNRESYVFYYFYTAENEEMTDRIDYHSSRVQHTFEGTALEYISYNFDTDGYCGERTHWQYVCAVCGLEYYVISDYHNDEYGRSIYSYYETTCNGYVEWRKSETTYGEYCEPTEWEWTNENPEGWIVPAPENGGHIFTEQQHADATCTQYGGYWSRCIICGYVNADYLEDCRAHEFLNGTCIQCGALQTEQSDAWDVRLEHLTINEFNNSDYTYIGILARGGSAENLSFTFALVYLDENGKEILVPFTYNAVLKTRVFYNNGNGGNYYLEWGSYYLEIPNASVDAEKAAGYQNYLGLRITVSDGYNQSVLTVTDHLHQYVSGVCSICGYRCTHLFNGNVVCVVCKEECKHENHDIYGRCNECRSEVKHNFDNGVCGDCGLVCVHDMGTEKDEQGRIYYVCAVCGLECYHDGGWGNAYGEGRCDVCGAYCSHYEYGETEPAFNSEYVCAICGLRCSHENHDWSGYCTVCRKEVGHAWERGECTACGHTCPHDFDGNTCTICGLYCEHEWDGQTGVCLICGHNCRHDMNDGLCSICGFRCDHADEAGNTTFAGGYCFVCGQECEHIWNFDQSSNVSMCTVCGLPCPHDNGNADQFKDCVCEICGWECAHSNGWWNGRCLTCFALCEHSWVYPPEERFPEMDVNSFCNICGLSCSHRDDSDNSIIDENDNCTVCGYYCKHEWADGRCVYCGNQCKHKNAYYCYCPTCGSTLNQHIYDATGKCYECGNECEHKFGFNENVACSICGYVCTHGEYSYEYFIDRWTGEHITNPDPMCGHHCLTCGFDVGHLAHGYKNGVCTDCGYECNHPYGLWDLDGDGINEYCNECHYGCPHENHAEDGNCYICGTHVEHNFNDNDICTLCGFRCEHVRHNYNGVCAECCERVGHNFENNYGDVVCTECGYVCRHIMEDFASGGNCSICGWSCPHYFNDNSQCRVCGYECEHLWNGYGMCNICQRICQHPDHSIDGICFVCQGIAPHGPYANGVCDVCGFVCGHEFLPNGFCRICQAECGHEYNSYGYCSICGYAEDGHGHEFDENGNGVCDICGYVCRHPGYLGETGYCVECHKECEHSWEYDSVAIARCTICNKWCHHYPYNEKWNGTTCTGCGLECTHEFDNRNDKEHSCIACGFVEEHKFSANGICEECGYSCMHNYGYTDGKCLECGFACSHEWQCYDNERHCCSICKSYERHAFTGSGWDTHCTECGWPCTHSFNNDVCKNCGWECTHEWAYNTDVAHYCVICQKVEEHSFENGRCKLCNWQCFHYGEDENGSCVICGLKCNHEWEPIEGGYNVHRCAICGRTVNHDYNASGGCTLCGFGCDHPEGLLGGTCRFCGMECPHEWQAGGSDEEHFCGVCTLIGKHTYDQNGYCAQCGWQCNHIWWNEGYCQICNKQCEHEWNSAYADIDGHNCTVCNYREYHKYDGGTCVYCGFECIHPNGLNGGACDICGCGCPHNEWERAYAEHICTACRMAEKHSFNESGCCEICKWQCSHEWQISDEAHFCNICQKAEKHGFDCNGFCSLCSYQCGHAAGFDESGACSICGYKCNHTGAWMQCDEDYHQCEMCRALFPHNWDEMGTCSDCCISCNHIWECGDDYNHHCSRCGVNWPHAFNGEGFCELCRAECRHDWFFDPCMHACNLCQRSEPHSFDCQGHCNICNYQCEHANVSEDGWCPDCGQSVNYSVKGEVVISSASKQN